MLGKASGLCRGYHHVITKDLVHYTGPCFDMKTVFSGIGVCFFKDKTIVSQSYFDDGNPYMNTGLPTSTELRYFVRILHAKYGSTNLAYKIRKLSSVSSVT